MKWHIKFCCLLVALPIIVGCTLKLNNNKQSALDINSNAIYINTDTIASIQDSVLETMPKSHHIAKITDFTDYVIEKHITVPCSDEECDTREGFLRQLDFEFPSKMTDTVTLAKIQEFLIDTLFNKQFHTTHMDQAINEYWGSHYNILQKSIYSDTVPNDADDYFEYGGMHNVHFEHFCGRTSYNENGLYIIKVHYTWYDRGTHHFPDTYYIAFNTKTGNYIKFLDIFSEEYDDHDACMVYDIWYFIESELRTQYPTLMSFQNWRNASFTIKPDALVLHYNHYILGCWADGEQEIEIPAKTAKLFLNEEWKHLWN